MKFTKSRNPNKRRRSIAPRHSETYLNELRNQRDALLANCKTESGKSAIEKAYSITIRP